MFLQAKVESLVVHKKIFLSSCRIKGPFMRPLKTGPYDFLLAKFAFIGPVVGG